MREFEIRHFSKGLALLLVRFLPGGPNLAALFEGVHLKVYYEQKSQSVLSFLGLGEKRYVKAVDDISFGVMKRKTLGVVGESGCGKSTLVKGIIGLEDITNGKAEFLQMESIVRMPYSRMLI